MENPFGSALKIFLGLYFTVYPDSGHNTGTVTIYCLLLFSPSCLPLGQSCYPTICVCTNKMNTVCSNYPVIYYLTIAARPLHYAPAIAVLPISDHIGTPSFLCKLLHDLAFFISGRYCCNGQKKTPKFIEIVSGKKLKSYNPIKVTIPFLEGFSGAYFIYYFFDATF